jgi:hypothetical protein
MLVGETQNERDARIEELWQKLDQQRKGKLDVNGLRKGLDKIDHRMFAVSIFRFCKWLLTDYSSQKRE